MSMVLRDDLVAGNSTRLISTLPHRRKRFKQGQVAGDHDDGVLIIAVIVE